MQLKEICLYLKVGLYHPLELTSCQLKKSCESQMTPETPESNQWHSMRPAVLVGSKSMAIHACIFPGLF